MEINNSRRNNLEADKWTKMNKNPKFKLEEVKIKMVSNRK